MREAQYFAIKVKVKTGQMLRLELTGNYVWRQCRKYANYKIQYAKYSKYGNMVKYGKYAYGNC